MASKSHNWFKSYGDFAELVDFAHWWSFIGKGLLLQPAQQACFYLDAFRMSYGIHRRVLFGKAFKLFH